MRRRQENSWPVLPKHKPVLLACRGHPPLATDGVKKHFCCPLEREVISKASHEQTWTRGVSGRHTHGPMQSGADSSWRGEAERRFCPEARVLSLAACAPGPSVISLRAGLRPIKAVGQNSSYLLSYGTAWKTWFILDYIGFNWYNVNFLIFWGYVDKKKINMVLLIF